MCTWDVVVVGSGGGPDETNLSSYLMKPHDSNWEDGVVALEAGSGVGALRSIMRHDPTILGPRPEGSKSGPYTAHEIYSLIQCFLVTHAHLDHVSGLILSAGSLKGARKRIFASHQALKDIESIFSDRIWPNLASWSVNDDSHKLLYSPLKWDSKYRPIGNDTSVRSMPLSHGHNETDGVYESSAFFIRHDPTSREFLFFGDVEPDSIAPKPQTIHVWRAAAPKIPKILDAVFIECSWPSGRPDDALYGHLTPEHLADELEALAMEVVKLRLSVQSEARNALRPLRKRLRSNPISKDALRHALDGLRVYIVHCKDGPAEDDRPINHIIADQVRALVDARGLGAQILAVDQGERLEI